VCEPLRAAVLSSSLSFFSLLELVSILERYITWGVDLRGQGHVCVLVLFTSDLQAYFFSLKETVLVMMVFLLKRESLIFKRESLSLRERIFDL